MRAGHNVAGGCCMHKALQDVGLATELLASSTKRMVGVGRPWGRAPGKAHARVGCAHTAGCCGVHHYHPHSLTQEAVASAPSVWPPAWLVPLAAAAALPAVAVAAICGLPTQSLADSLPRLQVVLLRMRQGAGRGGGAHGRAACWAARWGLTCRSGPASSLSRALYVVLAPLPLPLLAP